MLAHATLASWTCQPLQQSMHRGMALLMTICSHDMQSSLVRAQLARRMQSRCCATESFLCNIKVRRQVGSFANMSHKPSKELHKQPLYAWQCLEQPLAHPAWLIAGGGG